ncbi:MAG TPA: SIMPL domain-containing protein [Candidatus Sulfotelmatobacter sp.]|nr:SIMPL domain-containing protein [Candidatus Sulfotelmatobacter sp.]
MKTLASALALLILFSVCAIGQAPEVKFIADTLVVQAEGTYEADPDLATMTFQIFSQDKDLKQAYAAATQSMQNIADLATKNGLKKDDLTTGVLTVAPVYVGDRKKRARSYYVQGNVVLRIRDFSRIGSILDGSVEDSIADLRSLTYSLADEESAKKLAVAEAMRRAMGRASIALEQKGQKLGALRYMSLDVRQLVGVAQLQSMELVPVEVESAGIEGGLVKKDKMAVSPLPMSQPQKIAVNATVQCAFQIQ